MPTSSGEPAERSVSIFLRSSGDSQLTFSGRSNQRRLQASQKSPSRRGRQRPRASPRRCNRRRDDRPKRGAKKAAGAPKGVGDAALLRRHPFATILPQDGIEVASPAPITMRAPIRVAKLHTPAVAAIASDHSAIPMELMLRGEKRSSRMPMGSRRYHIGP